MNRKPKILIAVTDPVSAVFITGLPAYLKSKGFEVAVCSAPGKDMAELAEKEQISFFTLPLKREITLPGDLKALWQAIRLFRTYKPDIVNAGTPKAAFICMIASWLCHVPVRIYRFHGMRSATLTGFKKSIVRFTEKASAALAHQIFSDSPSLKQEAAEKGILRKEKCTVLHRGSANGIDLKKFERSGNEQIVSALKHTLRLDEDHFVLGYVGRLVTDKGIAELYEAFCLLNRKYKIKLILAGPEETGNALPPELISKIRNDTSVIMTGHVQHPEYYYPLFDLLVLPSYREGWGNTIIEAGAMGVPAVATDVTGCRDAVQDSITGKICQPRNAPDLSRQIEYYISHPEIRKTHGDQAGTFARTHFSNQQVWEAQYLLYKSLLAEKKPTVK